MDPLSQLLLMLLSRRSGGPQMQDVDQERRTLAGLQAARDQMPMELILKSLFPSKAPAPTRPPPVPPSSPGAFGSEEFFEPRTGRAAFGDL